MLKGLSLLSNCGGLSQLFCELLIFIDLGIEFELKSILRALYQKVSDSLGNSVTDVPHNKFEVFVNPATDFIDEQVFALLFLLLLRRRLLLLLLRILSWLLLRVVVLWGIIFILLWNNICTIL